MVCGGATSGNDTKVKGTDTPGDASMNPGAPDPRAVAWSWPPVSITAIAAPGTANANRDVPDKDRRH